MLLALGIFQFGCLLGLAAGDTRLGIGRLAVSSHIDVRKVAEVFGVEADWSEWILQPENGHGDALATKVCQAAGLCECRSANAELVAVTCAMPSLEALLVEHRGLVRLVEPDLEVSVHPPTRVHSESWPHFPGPCDSSWGLKRIGVTKSSSTGEGVSIYILDSGVRSSHEDFGGRAVPTADFTKGGQHELQCAHMHGECCEDDHGHGTHVAGIAIGSSYGVAKGATVHALKVLTLESGKLSWSVRALHWVRDNGKKPGVVSMSLDADTRSVALDDATEAVVGAGFIVVVAAGNEGEEADLVSPAGAPSAITVAATDPDAGNTLARYSNYGRALDIFAPGTSIISAGKAGDKATMCMTGTSMACPHVSGAVALILQSEPGLKYLGVLERLQANAIKAVHGAHSDDPPYFLMVPDELPVDTDPTASKPGHYEELPSDTRAVLVGASAAILALTVASCGFALIRRRTQSTGRQIELRSPVEEPELPELAETGAEPQMAA